ncbi:MAG: ribonuclease III [Oscillospiraceae bacterium]|nr:ribonuclease III [Oscillospiraceae bacterium]
MDESGLRALGILAIAQVGDAVFELMVRARLCSSQPTAAKLHRARVKHVNAAAQAAYMERLEPLLTEAERDVARRARNARAANVPKAVTRAEYAASTAFEALLGYLYLSGQTGRLNILFEELCHENGAPG